jgi:antitoxin (DNA-binding transcriptional repressor) of toxin-antitoxin stability system
MEHVSVVEAGEQLDELVSRVSREGITVELERDNRVVAQLSPAGRGVPVADLNRIFDSCPSLGDDADSFARDVERVRREVPRETIAPC